MPTHGADKRVEPDDPLELVGMRYPVASQAASDRAMARTFAEEFALMGWPRERVRGLFDSPWYAGPYAICARQGERFVSEILDDVFGAKER